MAVYTHITAEEASALLGREVTALEPLPDGIENSNYRLSCDGEPAVLTIIERQDPARLPAVLRWMDELAAAGLPVPRSLARDLRYQGKAAVLVSWLPGSHVTAVTGAQAASVGRLIAALVQHGSDHPLPPDAHGEDWRAQRISWARGARGALTGEQAELLEATLAALGRGPELGALERGPQHADLFLDNLLFQGEAVSGLVDFHYACTAPWITDLAMASNDLCSRPDGSLDEALEAALFAGYAAEGELLADEELAAWPKMRVACAFRFWLSRLYDQAHPRPGPMPLIKDPAEFERRLRDRLTRLEDA